MMLDRRQAVQGCMVLASGALLPRVSLAASLAESASRFQIACMTLAYAEHPIERALQGIQSAGYEYVAWGTTHRATPGSKPQPMLPIDAPLSQADELAKRCRDLGLEPLMMFSMVYPESDDGLKWLTHRIMQAGRAKVPQVLTFGHTAGEHRQRWIERFQQLGKIARDEGVLLVVKQHGGETGTGVACAEIIREVDDAGIRVNYDAGNVMDYLNLDPIPDIQQCADVVHSLCIKDHRNWPKDQDCGPGFGVIDHYRLLEPLVNLGRTIPLCCENIFAPLVPKPSNPDDIDALAKRARQYLEWVVAGSATARLSRPT